MKYVVCVMIGISYCTIQAMDQKSPESPVRRVDYAELLDDLVKQTSPQPKPAPYVNRPVVKKIPTELDALRQNCREQLLKEQEIAQNESDIGGGITCLWGVWLGLVAVFICI